MLLLIDGLAKALGDTAMGEALNGIHSPHPALRTEAIAVLGQRIGGRVDIALGLKAAPRYTGGREAVLEHLQSSHDPWTKKFALIAAGEIHRTLFLSRAEEALASADPLWIESALLGHAAGIKETQELEQEFVNHENPMVGETVATICRRPPNG